MSRVSILAIGVVAMGVAAQVDAAAILKGEIRVNEVGGSLVPNLRVRAEGANPATTNSEGQFVLTFPNLRPGDLTKVSIVREGWAIVNDVELERDLPANADARRLTILISKASERHQWALLYYRLRGRDAVDAEYQRKLQQLQSAQTATAQERDRLKQERDRALAQADELARKLAEAKPVDVSADVRQAQQLFLEGKVDAALQLLSAARLKQQAEQATVALTQAVQGYLLRGSLLAVKLQFDEAAAAYAEAVRLAPNDGHAQFAYADFNQNLNRFGPARQGYERALAIFRQLAKATPKTFDPDVARVLNNLGIVHGDQNRYAEARASYEEAMTIYLELAKTNPETFRPDVARVLNNLGVLHRDQNRPAEARESYEEAVTILRELAKTNPGTFRPDVARALSNLGALHRDQNRPAEARASYEEALAIFRELAKTNSETHRPEAARVLNNLGILHRDQGRYADARSAFEESLAIRRELVKTDPETYRPDVASTLNNLGNLYSDQKRHAEARAAYAEALAIYVEYAAKNPEAFAPDVARMRRLIDALPN